MTPEACPEKGRIVKLPRLAIFLFVLCGALDAQVQTYCSNFGGNIACTSYDNGASSQTYCSSIAGNLTCTTYSNDYRRMQNYEAGQLIGTAIGNAVGAAIERYRANKQIKLAKQAAWDQFVQDTISQIELRCEANPSHLDTTVVGCRTLVFALNQFVHKHQKDFVVDEKNLRLLDEATVDGSRCDKDPAADQSLCAQTLEQECEVAFQSIDKRLLDKKPYTGHGNERRSVW